MKRTLFLLLVLPALARADGVAQIMTTKSIPASTVAVIDPETGSSSGGGSTDVKVAPGDIINFRFRYFPVPDNNGSMDGMQGYLTEYIPNNTEIVGVRILDGDGDGAVSIPPRYPGMSVDSGSGGSISQVYADTGLFYTTDGRLLRNPGNQFITLNNGTTVNPVQGSNIAAIVGAGTIHSHNAWDTAQVNAFGGGGNPPVNRASPVAGSDTFYTNDAGNAPGPWTRIIYPGSVIGYNPPGTGDALRRTILDASTLGYDLKPLTAPAGATAVRIALGDIRVGVPGAAEVSLRVINTPLDTTQNADVDCAEVFGGDSSKRSPNVSGPGARDNPWATFLPTPACVFLNLLFDLQVNKHLALGQQQLVWTLHGKNLSINSQTNVEVFIGYDDSRGAVNSTTPASTTATCPAGIGGVGLTCRKWTFATLLPSQEYNISVNWTVGGGGQVTNVFRAFYRSTQLTGGFATQEIALVQPTPVFDVAVSPQAASVNGGADMLISGTITNSGTGSATVDQVGVFVPNGWEVRNINLGGGAVECAGPFTDPDLTDPAPHEAACASGFSLAATGGSRSISFLARPPAGEQTALFPIGVNLWAKASGFGGDAENFFTAAAVVPVNQVRTAPPTVTCPILTTAGSIRGTAPSGATVRIFLNGVLRATVTANGTSWGWSGFGAAFGKLYSGLEVSATAQVDPLLESVRSGGCEVRAPGSTEPETQCNNGSDDDGDNDIDYPSDTGCDGPDDPSERPQCSDGIDNDHDGSVDSGDSDCGGPNDNIEGPAPKCANGTDDDGDGKVDYPDDPGCHSANDNDELDPAFTPIDVKPRLLLVIDTSGSMNFNSCADDPLTSDEWTGGDGSAECPGADVACNVCNSPGCGNATADDSRIFKVKKGTSDVVSAFGEVEFGLMRFIQRAVSDFKCPVVAATQPAGGWQGAGASPCATGNGGETLVKFSLDDNRYDINQWLDNSANWNGAGEPPAGLDFELRGSGTTPIAGSLQSALDYMNSVKADDEKSTCRPYRVILLTDGGETCGGNPTSAAAALFAAGIKVSVIGFATTNPDIITQLNAIANAGDPGHTALFVDDSAELSAAFSQIISDSILVEICNHMDDNCNGLCDEGFGIGDTCDPNSPRPTCDNGQLGTCARTGVVDCETTTTTACNAPDGSGSSMAEICNRLDDNCNGLVDEDLTCTMCVPEVCNGADDDCDGMTDEAPLPGVGDECGIDTGACMKGHLECKGLQGLLCVGGVGPSPEVCNGIDDDCDGITDGLSEICYPSGAAGCTASPTGGGFTCQGVCAPGLRQCTGSGTGTCEGAVTPTTEKCNGVDDDCNGVVDDGFHSGEECESSGIGACKTTGILICTGDGKTTFCTAPVVTGTEEVCNGIDDDCDGMTDEEPLGAPIGGACGGQGNCAAGHFACVGGSIVCSGAGSGTPEVCDGIDNDCDGFIDEAPLAGQGEPCSDGKFSLPAQGSCKAGTMECVPNGQGGASMKCVGAVGPGSEICNNKDDDCDGKADDMAACPSPTDACVMGSCVKPCGVGEFPCGFGLRCKDIPDVGRYCVPNPCDSIQCETGFTCNPENGMCEDMCKNVTCLSPRTCVAGRCVDCFVTGCTPPSICRLNNAGIGACGSDPCLNINCEAGTFCSEGKCVALTCDPECGTGFECVAGTCHALSCNLENCFGRTCNAGQACDPTDGRCIADPCVGVQCPSGFACNVTCGGVATCKTETAQTTEVKVLATGSGGFSCAVVPGGRAPSAAPWLLLGLAALLVRRRRR